MDKDTKIDPFGFREYDARWVYPKDINLKGIENLGKGLGTQVIKNTKKNNPRVIVGHDYRSYSEEVKKSLISGLISTGCFVEDLGLSLSPMVYFAQFNLNSDAIAMVTASHNENGWTGVKMGIKKGLTHAPEEMSELKEITLNKKFTTGDGKLKNIDNFKKIYIEDLISKNKINKKMEMSRHPSISIEEIKKVLPNFKIIGYNKMNPVRQKGLLIKNCLLYTSPSPRD